MIPDFALLSATALITPYLATSVIAGPTPGLTVSWDGVNQISAGGWNPPDLNIASGQDAIVTTVNDHIDIYDKIGVSLLSESLNAFFGVAASNFVFDPRAIYDNVSSSVLIINNSWIKYKIRRRNAKKCI